MLYYDYQFGGMYLGWWFVWGVMLIWIFATPYDIPGQSNRPRSALDILNARFAAGELRVEEYQEKKKLIETEFTKK